MKNIIFIIAVCCIGYFGYHHYISDNTNSIITDGDNIIIKSGDNKFIAKTISDYDEDLRIYGVNRNNSSGWNPIAYADYIFIASPYIENSNTCEANSAHEAPSINIIADDDKIMDIISDLEKTGGRRKANIIGEKIYIKKFTFKGEDHTGAMKKQGKMDPREAILIKNIIL